MKKILKVSKWLPILLVICVTAYILTQQPKISVNSECAKFMLLKGGYRSWTVYYSDGLLLNTDGTTTNLWRWPTFAYFDFRKIRIRYGSTLPRTCGQGDVFFVTSPLSVYECTEPMTWVPKKSGLR